MPDFSVFPTDQLEDEGPVLLRDSVIEKVGEDLFYFGTLQSMFVCDCRQDLEVAIHKRIILILE